MEENQKAQHTPGPWKRSGQFERAIVTEHGSVVANVEPNGYQYEVQANIDLIAAAPELLEACHMAAAALYVASPAPSAEQLAKVYNALCDAISRAEGRN